MRFCAGSVNPAAATAIAHSTNRFMRGMLVRFGNLFRPSVRQTGAIAGPAGTVGQWRGDVMFITVIMAATLSVPAAQNAAAPPQRFDYLVRADFFAGAAGDEARLAHVMELCERALQQNPNHPEAHVWHG